jgi:hypothetical protein
VHVRGSDSSQEPYARHETRVRAIRKIVPFRLHGKEGIVSSRQE